MLYSDTLNLAACNISCLPSAIAAVLSKCIAAK